MKKSLFVIRIPTEIPFTIQYSLMRTVAILIHTLSLKEGTGKCRQNTRVMNAVVPTTGKTDVAVLFFQQRRKNVESPFLYSFDVGSAHPIGAFDTTADANIHVSIDFTYKFNDRFNTKLYLGLNQFTEESYTGFSHPRWINASLNIQALFPISSGLKLYAQAGPGGYWPKSGP